MYSLEFDINSKRTDCQINCNVNEPEFRLDLLFVSVILAQNTKMEYLNQLIVG